MRVRNKFNILGAAAYFFVSMAGSVAKEVPKDVISMDKAEATALKVYPGKVQSSELEQEDGRWVYSFEILAADKSLHEVWVDARKGEIVKHQIESAGQEAED